MKSGLEQLGYNIAQIVSTGEEAILSAEQCNPDLALMDIHLQGKMDGIEAATQLRFKSNIPVIFITGDMEEQSLERSKAAEPLGFLLKPFSIKELHSTIETGLSNCRSAQKRNHEALEAAEARYSACAAFPPASRAEKSPRPGRRCQAGPRSRSPA